MSVCVCTSIHLVLCLEGKPRRAAAAAWTTTHLRSTYLVHTYLPTGTPDGDPSKCPGLWSQGRDSTYNQVSRTHSHSGSFACTHTYTHTLTLSLSHSLSHSLIPRETGQDSSDMGGNAYITIPPPGHSACHLTLCCMRARKRMVAQAGAGVPKLPACLPANAYQPLPSCLRA